MCFASRASYASMLSLVLHSSSLAFVHRLGGSLTMASTRWVWGMGMLFLMGLLGPRTGQAQQPQLNLMPVPASVQQGSGSLKVDRTFSVALTGSTEPRLEQAVARFRRQLGRQTGLVVPMGLGDPSKAALVIHTDHASKPVQELGEDESYVLEVTPTGAKLNASTPLGTMHGLQTFLQLVDVS